MGLLNHNKMETSDDYYDSPLKNTTSDMLACAHVIYELLKKEGRCECAKKCRQFFRFQCDGDQMDENCVNVFDCGIDGVLIFNVFGKTEAVCLEDGFSFEIILLMLHRKKFRSELRRLTESRTCENLKQIN